jgi:hypothetical protein
MSKKISNEVRAMMEDKETNRDKKIPVMVTMKDDNSAEDTTRKLGVNTGFDILGTVGPWGENSIKKTTKALCSWIGFYKRHTESS